MEFSGIREANTLFRLLKTINNENQPMTGTQSGDQQQQANTAAISNLKSGK